MQVSRRLSDGLIVQYGHGLGERDGCELAELDAVTTAALEGLMASPSGGAVLSASGKLSVLPAPKIVRYKTASDFRAEYENPLTLPTRKQEIRDVLLGLRDPEPLP